jgi:solute carrier family 25 phosphate transporter 3
VYDETKDMFILPSVFTEAFSGDTVGVVSSNSSTLMDPLTPMDLSQVALGEKLIQKTVFGPIGSMPVQKQRDPSLGIIALLALSGAIGCCITHSAVIPLDVVKTRIQLRPGKYLNIRDGFTRMLREEGPASLFLGAGATMVGYIWYGVTVYPLYDVFKHYIFKYMGPIQSTAYHTPVVLLAGAMATIVACFGVCPCEKVRIRTVAQGIGAPSFLAALTSIVEEEGVGYLWQGLPPLMTRQVLFGMTKFLVFDTLSAIILSLLPSLGDDLGGKLLVSLTSGACAGVLSAIVSQPADTVLSRQAKAQKCLQDDSVLQVMSTEPMITGEGFSPNPSNSTMPIPSNVKSAQVWQVASEIYKEYGLQGFFLGLGSRCVWSGLIISGQFLLFDYFRNVFSVTPQELSVYWDVMNTLDVL